MMSAPELVCVVDHDRSSRESLLRLLNSAGLVAEAFESSAAYLKRPVHEGPVCLVLDVQIPELNGLDLQRVLVEKGRQEQLVFVTGNGDISMCAQAMKAGASDFLPKPCDDGEFLAACERALVRAAEHHLKHAGMLDARARIDKLTPREFQVFEGVIAGKMNKEIAADLGTALKTVKVQRGRVMEKMQVGSVAELVMLANKAEATRTNFLNKGTPFA